MEFAIDYILIPLIKIALLLAVLPLAVAALTLFERRSSPICRSGWDQCGSDPGVCFNRLPTLSSYCGKIIDSGQHEISWISRRPVMMISSAIT